MQTGRFGSSCIYQEGRKRYQTTIHATEECIDASISKAERKDWMSRRKGVRCGVCRWSYGTPQERILNLVTNWISYVQLYAKQCPKRGVSDLARRKYICQFMSLPLLAAAALTNPSSAGPTLPSPSSATPSSLLPTQPSLYPSILTNSTSATTSTTPTTSNQCRSGHT